MVHTALEISWFKRPLYLPHGFQYSGEDLAMLIPKLHTSSIALSCDETLADVAGLLLWVLIIDTAIVVLSGSSELNGRRELSRYCSGVR